MRYFLIILTLLTFIPAANAGNFSFTFEWGDIPLCTSGKPTIVTNPEFQLKNVPSGTEKIFFKLIDEDAKEFKHGGGVVEYKGQTKIAPGVFTYKSPCPLRATHTYTWKAYALSEKRKILAYAARSARYP